MAGIHEELSSIWQALTHITCLLATGMAGTDSTASGYAHDPPHLTTVMQVYERDGDKLKFSPDDSYNTRPAFLSVSSDCISAGFPTPLLTMSQPVTWCWLWPHLPCCSRADAPAVPPPLPHGLLTMT